MKKVYLGGKEITHVMAGSGFEIFDKNVPPSTDIIQMEIPASLPASRFQSSPLPGLKVMSEPRNEVFGDVPVVIHEICLERLIDYFCSDADEPDIVRADLEGFGVDVDKAKEDFGVFLDDLENQKS